ncbi:MAG: hypothetical protein Udaeo2_33810 [Candidatus Udaeobacter sp.]|nr:MAG: hypothetical protein Udaeo2_33810 [Candidatus Udaeobacter sp.]
MNKLTSLLIGCSLALAGAALAQQPVEQQSPSKGKHAPEKTHATQAQPKPNAAKHEAPAATQHGAMKGHPATNEPGAIKEHAATHEHGATNEPGAGKGHKAPGTRNWTAPKSNVSGISARRRPLRDSSELSSGERDKGPAAVEKTSTNPAAPNAAAAGAVGAAAGQQNVQANAGAKAKSPIRSKCNRSNRSTRTSVRSQAAAGSGGYLQPELSD